MLEKFLKVNTDEFFKKLNVYPDDIIFLSSFELDFTFRQSVWFLETLITYLGDNGTLIMDLSGDNYQKDLNLKFKQRNFTSKLLSYSKDKASLFADDNLAKVLLQFEDVIISDSQSHPYVGIGKYASVILAKQPKNFPNGNNSPLDKLVQLKAKAILLRPNVLKFKFNNYLFESNYLSDIVTNYYYNSENMADKFLVRSVDESIIKEMLNKSFIKKIFYYNKLVNCDVLAVDVSEYVYFGKAFLKENVWKN